MSNLQFADLTIVIGRIDPAPVFDRANALGLRHVQLHDFGTGHYSDIERQVHDLCTGTTPHLVFTNRAEVLDMLPLDRAEYGTRFAFIVCSWARAEPHWRNLTSAEVDDFFASLDVGIQHVSEILRCHGLW